ncbi:hypothetical protein [Adlercreutzia sp. ZJ138]|uniref:hypothetical protein n=1 Tax=Adlercreutzia sp. ZJ138 TaxID=2709405 RepID=UPI0013EDA383|nr:hypothetical protein [Adlercreutzia sp. ZJ138]
MVVNGTKQEEQSQVSGVDWEKAVTERDERIAALKCGVDGFPCAWYMRFCLCFAPVI